MQLEKQVEKRLRKKLVIRLPRQHALFLTAFFVLLLIHSVNHTSIIYSNLPWMSLLTFVKRLTYLMLLLQILLFSRYTLRELIVFSIVLFAAALSYLGSSDESLLVLMLVAVAAKGIPPKSLLKLLAGVKLGALILIPLLWRVGVLPTLYNKNVCTYGFNHKNVLGADLLLLCMLWFYFRYQNLRVWDALLWLLIGILSYFLVFSRSSTAMILLVSLCVPIFRLFDAAIFRGRWLGKVGVIMLLTLFALSMIGMVSYSSVSPFWTTLNSLMTSRLSSAHYCYEVYGLSVIGQDIPFVSTMTAQLTNTSSLILDNSYCRLMIYYGVIPAVIYLMAYAKMLLDAARDQDGALFISLVMFAVYGLSETYMLNVYYVFPLIIVFSTLGRPLGILRVGRAQNGKRTVGLVVRRR